MCNPPSSGQVRERVRDIQAVVGGNISPQHQAQPPAWPDLRGFLLSFSSLADYNGTVPAFTLCICCTWTVILTCHGYFMETKHWFLFFLSQSVELLRWILSSLRVWCTLKRKTRILQVYLLLLYYPKAVQQRISPFPNHAGGRNVIIIAFSAEKLLKALPVLGTMVCESLQTED